MRELGIINGRKLIYQKYATDINWEKALPNANWLAIIVVDDKKRTILNEISWKVINHNACYVCCAGKQSERLHDKIDEDVIFREAEEIHLPAFDIITTWDNDIDDALWYAAFTAMHDTEKIDTLVCLDTTDLDIDDKYRVLNEPIK
jgi:hypothetical protein